MRPLTFVMISLLAACSTGQSSSPSPQPDPEPTATEGPTTTPAAEPAPPPSAAQVWSAPSGGLRGRLVVTDASIDASRQLEIFLELENRTSTTVSVQAGAPFPFAPTLRDGAGATVEPTSTRIDLHTSHRWVEVGPSSSVRLPVTQETEDGAAPAQVDFIGSVYRLAPGSYTLAARYVSSEFLGTPPGPAWSGTLELPPIPLEVTPTTP